MTDEYSGKSGVTSRDLFEFRLPSLPRISPDGRRVAWVETCVDPDSNSYRSRIQMADYDSGETTALTDGPRDGNPAWSPDGSMLAFVGRRKLKVGERESSATQVYVMKVAGGETWPVTDLRSGAGAPVWSPDGGRIAFTTRIDERKGLQRIGDPDPSEDDPYVRFNHGVLVIRRRKWKANGVPFIAHHRSHVVVVEVTAGPEAERPAPRLAVGGELDVAGFCWAPSGDRIAFVTLPDPQPGEAYKRRAELRVADLSRPPAASELVVTVSSLSGAPSWSPDGKTISVLGHDSSRGSAGHSRMLLVSPDGSSLRCLTERLDRSLGDTSVSDTRTASYGGGPIWCDSGRTLLTQVNDMGKVQLLAVPAEGGDVRWLTSGDQQVLDFGVNAAGDRMALVITTFLSPGDIYVGDGKAGNLRRLTDLNGWLTAERTLSRPERFLAKADDGVEIEGWAMRPVGFEKGKKYPTVLEIHGGPTRHYGYCYFHELQLLAAKGYAVIFGNPRGSQGYSEDFCAAIKGDRGNRDYQDVMQFTDGAIAKFDFIDTARLGVAGGSYGGFMTNWIIGHTDRFKAAVTQRSSASRYTEFGTGDRGFQRESEAGGGAPWENPDGYMRISPVQYIGNCTTPTMVIHSDQDMRAPVEQGELLYAALFRVGVPTEFVRFPGENHELSRSGKPWHRVFRLDKIVEWFDRWLG